MCKIKLTKNLVRTMPDEIPAFSAMSIVVKVGGWGLVLLDQVSEDGQGDDDDYGPEGPAD